MKKSFISEMSQKPKQDECDTYNRKEEKKREERGEENLNLIKYKF
jgi:hypothetical protein